MKDNDRFTSSRIGELLESYIIADNRCAEASPEHDAGQDAEQDAGLQTAGGTTALRNGAASEFEHRYSRLARAGSNGGR